MKMENKRYFDCDTKYCKKIAFWLVTVGSFEFRKCYDCTDEYKVGIAQRLPIKITRIDYVNAEIEGEKLNGN